MPRDVRSNLLSVREFVKQCRFSDVGWGESSRPTNFNQQDQQLVGLDDSTHPTGSHAMTALQEAERLLPKLTRVEKALLAQRLVSDFGARNPWTTPARSVSSDSCRRSFDKMVLR